MNSAVPPRSNWLCHDRFITRWAAQAMRQYFFLTGGATSLIWSSPSAFCKSAKARSHFSIGFVMGTGKTLLKTSTTLMESKRVMTAFGASLVGSLITMEPTQNNEGCTSFEDLTNTINGGDQTASNSQAQVDERAQRKREREKARYAAMTQEERDEKIKKLREKYHQTKAETALAAGSRGVGVESNKENTDAMKLKREREMTQLAAMTQEERNEKNRKRRERYHQKEAVGVESTMESTDGCEDSDWLHRSNSYKPLQIDKDNIYEYSDRCIDQSGMIDLTDASPDLNLGVVNASSSIDNIVTCPKERKHELDRAPRAAMSLNKRCY